MPPSFSNKTSTYSEWKLLTSKVLGCFCPVFLSLDVLFICGLWSTSLWTFGFPIRRVARCLFHTWSTKHVKHASPLCTYRNAMRNKTTSVARLEHLPPHMQCSSCYPQKSGLTGFKQMNKPCRVYAQVIVSNTKYLPRFDLGRYLPLPWSKHI